MPAMQQIPDDHPLMIAWEAYRATPEAANSDQWARTVRISEPMQGNSILDHPHLVGSLWAAFEAGYRAGGGRIERTPWEIEGRKPTIAELEAILHEGDDRKIEILPDGSIRAVALPDAT